MPGLIRKPFPYRYYYATFAIIAVNAAVFLLTSLNPQLRLTLGLSVRGLVSYRRWYELVTYLFTHSGKTHVVLNMLGLFFFGVQVERTIGSSEFCLMYFTCGILGGILSLAAYFFIGSPYTVLIGASGAITSVLFVYAVLFPRSTIYVLWLIPVPAPLLIVIYAVIEVLGQMFSSSSVAHLAHLSGFLLAWAYLVVRMGIHPLKVWRNAWRK